MPPGTPGPFNVSASGSGTIVIHCERAQILMNAFPSCRSESEMHSQMIVALSALRVCEVSFTKYINNRAYLRSAIRVLYFIISLSIENSTLSYSVTL